MEVDDGMPVVVVEPGQQLTRQLVTGPASSVEASPEEKNARGDGGVAQLQEIAADAILVQPVGPVDPPVEAQAPAPTPTRSKRASALKASAKLNNWHAVEGLPFSHIVGKDIYLPANRPAGTGESRRTRDRNRAAQHPSQSGATPGGPGTQTPPPPARTSRPKDKPQSQTEPRPAAKPSRATTERVINYAEDEVEDESEIEVESDRDEDFSIKGYKKKGKGQHQKPASKRQKTAATAPAPPVDPALDTMLGCGKCRYAKGGCNTCRAAPQFSRPRARWDPSRGHHQDGIPTVKPFRPTPEEFKDPIAYITKIMPEAAPYGLAHIIPPEGWAPPFALEKGTNGANMDSFRFSIRRQLTSHLCYRAAPQRSTGGDAEGAQAGGGAAESRYGRKLTQQPQQQADATVKAERDGMAVENASNASPRTISGEGAPAPSSEDRPLTADDVRAALAAVGGLLPGEPGPAPPEAQPLPPVHSTQENASGGTAGGVAAPHSPPHTEPVPPARGGATANSSDDGSEGSAEDGSDGVAEFGFAMLDKKLTLRSFAAYADWAKSVHFSNPPPTGEGTSTEPKKRPTKMLPLLHTLAKEPSVEEVEAEFWRIVETPDSHLESLYGQDLDSGHHGSGFPLPEWRRRLLEEHLCATRRSMGGGSYSGGEVRLPGYSNETEREYAEHSWNINNMPRCKSSMLRYLLGDGLITGVMVPWLYVGSCLSAFCWHVEDHALYSVNYHHLGAPKVWYGVPASATTALEEAMKDALPHLFEASPHLLYQLVTMLSPKQLQARGVPVYRVVHEAGSFVITMPDAYHAGFNTGFNCAEAVNFAAPSWIPYGTDVAQKYRNSRKPVAMSHDSLLVALAIAAQHVPATKPPLAAAAADSDESEGWRVDSPTAPLPQSALEATGFGPLGEIPWQDAPLEGIVLGTGELALRAEEERERWAAGMASLGVEDLPRCVVDNAAPPSARDPDTGVLINTAECDCAECSGDLWLAAVVSPAAPNVAVCLEHAAALVTKHKCPLDTLRVLCRHSPDDLQALVDAAVERVEGAAEAVEKARVRRAQHEAERVRATPKGPMYRISEHGYVVVGQPPSAEAMEGGEQVTLAPARKRGRPQGSTKVTAVKAKAAAQGGWGKRGRPSKAQLQDSSTEMQTVQAAVHPEMLEGQGAGAGYVLPASLAAELHPPSAPEDMVPAFGTIAPLSMAPPGEVNLTYDLQPEPEPEPWAMTLLRGSVEGGPLGDAGDKDVIDWPPIDVDALFASTAAAAAAAGCCGGSAEAEGTAEQAAHALLAEEVHHVMDAMVLAMEPTPCCRHSAALQEPGTLPEPAVAAGCCGGSAEAEGAAEEAAHALLAEEVHHVMDVMMSVMEAKPCCRHAAASHEPVALLEPAAHMDAEGIKPVSACMCAQGS